MLFRCLDRLDDDTTSLGVGDRVLDLDEAGEELGEEGANGVFVVDELGHVVLRGSKGELALGEEGTNGDRNAQ